MAEPHSKLKCENDAVVSNDRDDTDSFQIARWRKIVEQPTTTTLRRNEKIFVDERASYTIMSVVHTIMSVVRGISRERQLHC